LRVGSRPDHDRVRATRKLTSTSTDPETSIPETSRASLATAGFVAIGLVLIAACHLPTLAFGFLDWDDNIHVTQNAAVFAPDTVSLRDKLTTPALGYPIPITIATYAFEVRVLGLAPWHFHLLNVVAHVVSCALVFLLALRIRLTRIGALCAMLLFGLHPVAAEPVSWVTGRKDLLATALGLATLLLAWPPASPRRRVAAIACYAIGLLCKPTIAPLCLFVALADPMFGSGGASETSGSRLATLRTRALTAVRTAWPYAAVLVPVMILGILGQRAAGAISDPERAGASFVRATWYALGLHLRLLLGLEEPTAKYLPFPWPPPYTPSVDLLPLLAAAIAWLLVRRLPPLQRRVFEFGLFWVVLTYLPNSNIIPLTRYLADSYVYLPLIGAAFCVGALIDALLARFEGLTFASSAWVVRSGALLRYAVPLLIAFACVPPLLRSQARFADDRSLWSHALTRYPYNPRLCRMWANGMAKDRGAEVGLRATDRCLSVFGDELFAKNKGMLLGRLGRFDEAREWLERARKLRPADVSVLSALANLPPSAAGGER
jgi:hypothetical protein